MRLEHLVGQERAVGVLRNAIRRGRVAHAYLFHGPDGVGKSTAARLFAQALNCEAEEARRTGTGCGECRQCVLAGLGNHPDVRLLTAGGEGGKSVIRIETIRDHFVYDVHLKPVLGRYKIYVLDPADRTAHLAIHTVLKVLEEPPPYVVAILVTAHPAALPPTIPSRCQQVTFQLAGTEAIAEHLVERGVEPARAESLAHLSGGRAAWAIRAVERPEVLAAREALLNLCAGMQRRGVAAGLRAAEEIKEQSAALARQPAETESENGDDVDDAEETGRGVGDRALRGELPWCLDVMVSWYRDLLAAREGAAVMNRDYEEAVRAQAGKLAEGKAERAIEAILETRRAIERNANIDLALESVAIRLAGGA